MSKKGKRRIWWLVGGVALALATVGYFSGWASEAALNRELAEARRSGFPVEPEDIFVDSPPADEDNAALIYERMAEIPAPEGHDYRILTQHFEALRIGYDDFDRDLARAYFDAHSELLTLGERAATLPRYRAKEDLADPERATIPALRSASDLVDILVARAMLSMEDGDVQSALEDLHKILLISSQLDESGFLIGQRVAFRSRGSYARAVERIITFPQTDEDFLRGVLSQINEWPTATDWSQTLRFQAYAEVWTWQHLDEWEGEYGFKWDWKNGVPKDSYDWASVSWHLPKTRFDAARLALEHWTNVFETYDPNFGDPMAWAIGITATLPTGKGFWHGSEQLIADNGYPLDSTIESALRSVVRRELLKSSLEVLLAMRRNSNDPFENLGIDPWTGTSLLYKETTDGFKIYSVGRDGSDDGGQWGGVHDIVFMFPLKRGPARTGFYLD